MKIKLSPSDQVKVLNQIITSISTHHIVKYNAILEGYRSYFIKNHEVFDYSCYKNDDGSGQVDVKWDDGSTDINIPKNSPIFKKFTKITERLEKIYKEDLKKQSEKTKNKLLK